MLLAATHRRERHSPLLNCWQLGAGQHRWQRGGCQGTGAGKRGMAGSVWGSHLASVPVFCPRASSTFTRQKACQKLEVTLCKMLYSQGGFTGETFAAFKENANHAQYQPPPNGPLYTLSSCKLAVMSFWHPLMFVWYLSNVSVNKHKKHMATNYHKRKRAVVVLLMSKWTCEPVPEGCLNFEIS